MTCCIWPPAPLVRDTAYQKTLSVEFTADGGTAKLSKDEQNVLGIESATYPANARPTLIMNCRVSLNNYAVDLSSRTAPPVSRAELGYFLQPSRYVPTDRIVKQVALKATAGATTDIEKARAIYEWVVEIYFVIQRFEDVAAAMFGSCWSPAIWAANART
ncbi:hypothetical protein [Acidobacterium sp. S8]|uniref:hypothetical protein n=1 Tax=Acidobacterium sp. S8 TaxID=1641854 RepID=UPI00131D3362|nr:hypothetical protein [Acidobacterium sp. S8]